MIDTGKQLTRFLQDSCQHFNFHQSHFSLYAAILMCYEKAWCQNPFWVTRRVLMKHSGIRSFATYHKCMKDLVSGGYIIYEPSYNPHLGSQLSFINDGKTI